MKSVHFTSRLFLVLALSALPSPAESATEQESTDLAALRSKAERGNPIAQYNLGLALVERRQQPTDLPEAFVWLSVAAERGSRSRALDALLRELTASQLAEGQRRLAELRALHPEYATPLPRATATPPSAPSVAETIALAVTDTASPIAAPEIAAAVDVDEKRQLSQELAAAWKESEQLQAELTKLNAELKQSRDALAVAANERAALNAEVEKSAAIAAANLASAQNEARATAAALAQANARIADLTAAAARLETERAELLAFAKAPPPPDPEVARLRGQLEASTSRLQQTATDLALAREQAAALESTQRLLASTELKLRDAVQQAGAFHQELSASTAASTDAVTRLAALEARIATQQTALETVTASRDEALAKLGELAALDRQTTQLAGANAELSAKASSLLAERTVLIERIAALDREHEAGLNTARSQIAELAHSQEQSAAVEATQRLLAASDLKLQEATRQIDALTREIVAGRHASVEADGQLAQLRAQFTRQQADLDAALSTRDQALAKASHADATELQSQQISAANRELTAKLAAAVAELQSAQNGTRAAEAALISANARVAELSALQTKLEVQLSQAGERSSALDATQRLLATSESRLRDALQETDTLKRDIATRQQSATDAASHVAELQSRVAAQKFELDALIVARDQAAATAGSAAVTQSEQQQQLAATNVALTAKLAAVTQERGELANRLDALEQTSESRASATTVRLADAAQQLEATRRELAAATEKAQHEANLAQQLGTEKASLTTRVATLERELASAQADAPARLAALEHHLDVAKRDSATAKRLLDEATAGAKRAEDERGVLAKQYDELAASQPRHEADRERLRAAIASAEAAIATKQSVTEELASARRELAAAQSARAESESKLHAAAAAAGAEFAARLATAEKSAGEAVKLREQLAKLAANSTAASDKLKAAEGQAAELTANNARLRDTIAKLEAQRVPDTRAELEAARVHLLESQSKLTAATTELAVLRQQETARAELASRIRDLESANSALTAKLSEPQPAAPPSAASAEVNALRARAETAERVALGLQAELARTNQLLAGERTTRRLAVAPTRPAAVTSTAVRTVTATAAAPVTSAEATPPRTHTIVFGDTLSGISLRYYGTANRWREIFAANRANLRDERTLVAGRVLEIP